MIKKDMPQYQRVKMSKNDSTVSEFKRNIKKQYPGYDIDVLMGDGTPANGNTKLGTVRDSYEEDTEDDSD
ncbi:hypothetical protein [Escherichia sp. E4694]|uniref:hypothetical protein n=1 Tax=Escherichia sp. E4694 TaxID=2044464 RepID=UPI001081F4BE|nr:hypothetical protein [Escherichia sp. E4694]